MGVIVSLACLNGSNSLRRVNEHEGYNCLIDYRWADHHVLLLRGVQSGEQERRNGRMSLERKVIKVANMSEDHLVKCPYYKTNARQVIHCEGLEDGMAVHLAFATHGHLVDYKDRFCRRYCYNQCQLARILEQKYGNIDST